VSISTPAARRRAALAALAALLLAPGCGYSIRPPYNESIRTIYLPVFKSYRFRQDLNIKLTEMLRQEIINRTPYTIVSDPDKADARLEGTVVFDDKNVMVENPYNLPRNIIGTMTVKVTYVDNRSGAARSRTLPEAVVHESASFNPEIGESAIAGFEKIMEKVVSDIVSMMEEPWGDEYVVDDQPIARPRPTGLLQDPEL
jgi:hypothetical protein